MGATWGKVVKIKGKGGKPDTWGVRGVWKGERIQFSSYQTVIGRQPCRTEAEARQLQAIIGHEVAHGIFDQARYRKEKPLHVRKYAEAWLNQVRPVVKHSTWKAYRAAVRSIQESLGDVFLPDLQHDRIHQWVTGLLAAGMNIKTVKNYHGVLAAMLADAKRARKIAELPDLVRFRGGLSVPYKDPSWLTVAQQEAILAHIPAADRWIFRFLMATGLRPSEGRAVMRKDVFADRGYIVIRRTWAPGPKGQGEILQTVKQKREGWVPIDERTAAVLKEMPVNLHTEFLFVNSRTGRPYTKNINRDFWNPACEAAGIRIPLKNATRHSLANQLLASGEDLRIVSLRLRHSSVKVTEGNYASAAAGIAR